MIPYPLVEHHTGCLPCLRHRHPHRLLGGHRTGLIAVAADTHHHLDHTLILERRQHLEPDFDSQHQQGHHRVTGRLGHRLVLELVGCHSDRYLLQVGRRDLASDCLVAVQCLHMGLAALGQLTRHQTAQEHQWGVHALGQDPALSKKE